MFRFGRIAAYVGKFQSCPPSWFGAVGEFQSCPTNDRPVSKRFMQPVLKPASPPSQFRSRPSCFKAIHTAVFTAVGKFQSHPRNNRQVSKRSTQPVSKPAGFEASFYFGMVVNWPDPFQTGPASFETDWVAKQAVNIYSEYTQTRC